MNIPIHLYYKILTYGAILPPHFIAYTTAKIKPIFSNELNCNISGEIKLIDNLDEEELNEAWFMYLIENQY